jgi:hypothetical protein
MIGRLENNEPQEIWTKPTVAQQLQIMTEEKLQKKKSDRKLAEETAPHEPVP